MTYGLSKSGIKVVAGIDNDGSCRATYERNNPRSKFILADICALREESLQRLVGLERNDDNLVLIGCSPCQYWSIIRTDKSKSKKSRNLLLEFKRFVEYFNPGYVLVENVPGILHRNVSSGLRKFIFSLEKAGYKIHAEIVNLNEYGVPQMRRRFSLLATRLHEVPIFPKPSKRYRPKVRDFIGERNGFEKVKAGHRDRTQFNHSTSSLSNKNLLRLTKTPRNGGSWLDWAKSRELKRRSYDGTGFPDNYGRMKWGKPAPTITTRFHSISNGRFAHPNENRGLSIREGATLQTFPKRYVFKCPYFGDTARIVGNAVPPEFAKRLGRTIVNRHRRRKAS